MREFAQSIQFVIMRPDGAARVSGKVHRRTGILEEEMNGPVAYVTYIKPWRSWNV